jgi:hypothetical protein
LVVALPGEPGRAEMTTDQVGGHCVSHSCILAALEPCTRPCCTLHSCCSCAASPLMRLQHLLLRSPCSQPC